MNGRGKARPGTGGVRREERPSARARRQKRRRCPGLRDEEAEGEEQLVPVIEDGTLVYEFPDLLTIREVAGRTVQKLPQEIRKLEDPGSYDVHISLGLETRTTELRERLESQFG